MPYDARCELRVPGDKSITHRALMLAALGRGSSRLSGLLPAADTQSTVAVLRALGVRLPDIPEDGAPIAVAGHGLHPFHQFAGPLDCGNSGTTARLLLGLLAGQPLRAVLTGDDSLRARPMRRVTEPLASMGARFTELGEPDRLPIEVEGGPLQPIRYANTRASAQVKSALLLAGLTGGARVEVTEPAPSRDHTERMLRAMGANLMVETGEDGVRIASSRPRSSTRSTWPCRATSPPPPSSSRSRSLAGAGRSASARRRQSHAHRPAPGSRADGRRGRARGCLRGVRRARRGRMSYGRRRCEATTRGCRGDPGDDRRGAGARRARRRAHRARRGSPAPPSCASRRPTGWPPSPRTCAPSAPRPRSCRTASSSAARMRRSPAASAPSATTASPWPSASSRRCPATEIEIDDPGVVAISYPGFWADVRRVAAALERS